MLCLPENCRIGNVVPFEPVELDGMLFRQHQDDKGPVLHLLFAVKALVNAEVRLISACVLFQAPIRKHCGAVSTAIRI